MRPLTDRPRRGGFTLIELLVVIVILALLIALLVPAIGSAVKTARNAAVTAEINQLAQALADFKSKYGDYPPSRILLNENGYYNTYDTTYTYTAAESTNAVDISNGQLAQRSLSYLRRFFPRLQLTSDPSYATSGIYNATTGWPDFNGNGGTGPDTSKLLTGDECLVFFLGGIPQLSTENGVNTYGMTGLSKNPVNPFQTVLTTPANRVNPLFEFKGNRLADIENDGFPSYYDSLSTNRPYVYFSAYNGTGYDPNDVNYDTGNPLVEIDESTTATTPIMLNFSLTFPVKNGGVAISPAPNPYTTTQTVVQTTTVPYTPAVIYQNAQTFQIVSAGTDGQYGVGGLYSPTGATPLPVDTTNSSPSTDQGLRTREKDNLTNFTVNKLD
jgi:prepilin-type N-terminal cleavage/methylation domain-containing protein